MSYFLPFVLSFADLCSLMLVWATARSQPALSKWRNRLSQEWFSAGAPQPEDLTSPRSARVVFSFDSCGWLFVYHFGVGAWLSEHLELERKDSSDIPQEAGNSMKTDLTY